MADYRFLTLAEQTVEFVTAGNTSIAIKITLIREESDYYGNGDYKPTRNGLRINTDTIVNGKTDGQGVWIKNIAVPEKGYVAIIGRIGLTAENLARVNAAMAQVESHEAWVAKQAAEMRGMQVDREYEEHVKAVEDMMTLKGNTY
jgi:hypothetical protein